MNKINTQEASRESGKPSLELHHKIRLTDYLTDLIDPADPSDPIARQYMPSADETIPSLSDQEDPIGDKRNGVGKILVHRYPDRLLFLATDHCAAYCRFCFRKDRVGKGDAVIADEAIDDAIDYIQKNKTLWEVIFSGGDPLILSPRRLKEIITRISAIPHVKVIRFHTRLPVSDPVRITKELADALHSDKATYMVVHVNHSSEITQKARDAFKILRQAGISLLSQSVLLRSVNNDADALEDLFRELVAAGVKPYYLHHPDLVEGSSHFQLSLEEGQGLMKALRGKISGLCWPTYVLDIPGGYGKIPVNDSYLQKLEDGRYMIEDVNGRKHLYPPKKI